MGDTAGSWPGCEVSGAMASEDIARAWILPRDPPAV